MRRSARGSVRRGDTVRLWPHRFILRTVACKGIGEHARVRRIRLGGKCLNYWFKIPGLSSWALPELQNYRNLIVALVDDFVVRTFEVGRLLIRLTCSQTKVYNAIQ